MAPVTVDALFRVAGRTPEFWDPETGNITRAHAFARRDGRTAVTLQLDGEGSVFVVFRKPAGFTAVAWVEKDGKAVPLKALLEPAAGEYRVTDAGGESVKEVVPAGLPPVGVEGPWEVRFPAEMGGGAVLRWNALASWADNPDPRIRVFSGTAKYRAEFFVDGARLKGVHRVVLDLGRVETFADVTLNGRHLRLLWHPPYRMEVGNADLRAGRNVLEVSVTNLLVNSLIGDQGKPGAERRMWSTYQPYTKDSPLLPAGLLGPVTVEWTPMMGPKE